MDLDQLAAAIAEAKDEGPNIFINSPAISSHYERLGRFERAGDGFAMVVVEGMG